MLAKDVLTMSDAIISLEGAFSLIVRIIEERRRFLNSNMVEMLTCVINRMRGTQGVSTLSRARDLKEAFYELYQDPVETPQSSRSSQP